jgi:hypothetical protein
LQENKRIDTDNLDFSIYNPSIDDFSSLDFREDDNSDPLKVDEFIHKNPKHYVDNHVSTIFTVRHHKEIAAFFTVSMSSIRKKDIELDDKINVTFSDYPALLLGQIGVDKKFRGRGLGQYICKYCSGFGQRLNNDVACAFLILQTTKELAEKYYESKCDFRWKKSNKDIVWMYRKLF